MTDAPTAQPRYVLLNPGDVIRKGDEYYSHTTEEWESDGSASVGRSVRKYHMPYRRILATPAPTHADRLAVALALPEVSRMLTVLRNLAKLATSPVDREYAAWAVDEVEAAITPTAVDDSAGEQT